MKFKFKISRSGSVYPSEIDIVCCDKSVRNHFPPPRQSFKLVVDDKAYVTSIRDLKKTGWTSIAKTFEGNGVKISRADLCSRHNLNSGQTVFIEEITPKQVYRLI